MDPFFNSEELERCASLAETHSVVKAIDTGVIAFAPACNKNATDCGERFNRLLIANFVQHLVTILHRFQIIGGYLSLCPCVWSQKFQGADLAWLANGKAEGTWLQASPALSPNRPCLR
jgi:hypothetical protein